MDIIKEKQKEVPDTKTAAKQKLKDAEKRHQESQNKLTTLLKRIEKEFRTHVVFELLTYFYHQHKRGADKE